MTDRWRQDPGDAIRSVLADRRFALRDAGPPRQRSWFDALRDWLAGIVRDLLHGLDRALGANAPFETVIGFALVAAALALLGLLVWLAIRAYLRDSRSKRLFADAPTAVEAAPRSWDLRAAAAAAARAGRLRAAAALLFAAAARALDERGRVTYDPARTPGEYRRLVRDPAFDALAGDAVVALFAAADPAPALVERMSGSYDRFVDTLT